MKNVKYAGFWIRFCATMIDSLIISLILLPVLYGVYGDNYFTNTNLIKGPIDFILSYIVPVIATIALWMKFKGTPGKTMLGLHIVDFKTGEALNIKQSIIRYLGYFVMSLPLCLGFIFIAFDKHKRGWHDKMAGSAVVYKKSLSQNQSH